MSIIRAAVIQNSPAVFDLEATLDKVGRLTDQARRDGAELVVFPEAFVSAYPKGLDFGARIGSRTPEGRDDFRRYFDSAVELPGRLAARADRCRQFRPSRGWRHRAGRRDALLHRCVLWDMATAPLCLFSRPR